MMTAQQAAELAELDAAVIAAPEGDDDVNARLDRARWRAKLDGGAADNIAAMCEDCEPYARMRLNGRLQHLLFFGRNHFQTFRKSRHHNRRLAWEWAMASAHICVALEQVEAAAPWVSRELVVALCDEENSVTLLQTIEAARGDEIPSPQGWRTLAMLFAIVRSLEEAAKTVTRALQLEIEAGLWPDWDTKAGEPEFSHRLPLHEQLAWLNLRVESAPDDADGLLERANWSQKQHQSARAFADLERVLQLRPDDADVWEQRGAYRQRSRFDEKNPIELAFADFRRALRVRINAGEPYSPDELQRRGDSIAQNGDAAGDDAFRAHAYYSLALEARPSAELYLRRARTMHFRAKRAVSGASAERAHAHADYIGALALDGSLDEARARIVQYLVETLARPTAHEQIEALLRARESLMGGGVAASLAGAIVGEVERALSA